MGTTIDATVCIPWRATEDRQAAYERVMSFWAHHGFTVIPADSDADKPFNLSQARNNAVRHADTDLVIVADADTIPDIGAVMFALSYEFDGVTWPFRQYRHIPNECVGQADLMSVKPDRGYAASVGGIFICPRELYWRLGGCDELFTGWGFEDNAFHLVAQTLSDVQRLDGIVFSFNHDSTHRDMSPKNPNRIRFGLYQLCSGNEEYVRELVRR